MKDVAKEKLYRKVCKSLMQRSLDLRKKVNRLATQYNLELLKLAKGEPSIWEKVQEKMNFAINQSTEHNNRIARMDMTYTELKKLMDYGPDGNDSTSGKR